MHLDRITFAAAGAALIPESGNSLQRALEGQSLELHPEINIFTGPNASGKTIILRTIAAAPQNVRDESGLYWTKDENSEIAAGLETDPSWPRTSRGKTLPATEITFFHVPATRTPPSREDPALNRLSRNIPARDLLRACQDMEANVFNCQLADAARHKLASDLIPRNPESLTKREELKLAAFVHTMETAYKCAYEICEDLLSEPRENEAIMTGIRGIYTTSDTRVIIPGAETFGDMDEIKSILTLSHGTSSTLLWIQGLALQMATDHQWREGWRERNAILTIDEPENSLHPEWQKRVLKSVRRHFPNVQIFAATHSPFVVQGTPEARIHRLARTPQGDISIATIKDQPGRWSIERIAAELMNVHEPGAQRAAELRRQAAEARDKNPERQSRAREMLRQADAAEFGSLEELEAGEEPSRN